MVLARAAFARSCRGGLRRARLSADPRLAGADGRWRLRGRPCHRSGGSRSRRPVRRSRPLVARARRPGLRADQAREGRRGLRLVDEVLVAATAGELSPIVTGIVYCNTIAFCRDAFELRHAREWTEALSRWCERQPQMVAHKVSASSTVPRSCNCAERGRRPWRRRGEPPSGSRGASSTRSPAARPTTDRGDPSAAGGARCRRERLPRPSRCGSEPQPGLALLRLAQGEVDAATAGSAEQSVRQRNRSSA